MAAFVALDTKQLCVVALVGGCTLAVLCPISQWRSVGWLFGLALLLANLVPGPAEGEPEDSRWCQLFSTTLRLPSVILGNAAIGFLLAQILCILAQTIGVAATAASSNAPIDKEEFFNGVGACIFMLSFLLFHLAEFYFVVVFHPDSLHFASFVLNPVPCHLYLIVFLLAAAEFVFTPDSLPPILSALGITKDASASKDGYDANFWGGAKMSSILFWVRSGLLVLSLLCLSIGMLLRVAALWTAGSNFTHLIRTKRHEGHQLVQQGVYNYVRHPSYMGWFLWTLGTQIALRNPLSFLLFFAIAYTFLFRRIRAEEYYLLRFFGEEYADYARSVPAGIPCASQLCGSAVCPRRTELLSDATKILSLKEKEAFFKAALSWRCWNYWLSCTTQCSRRSRALGRLLSGEASPV
ncbi:unnamed protein product [Amoebophrya sp. A25]|nr:unnamed protein product [Amoebophrya sp. A25]|eukprot:GSA25T00015728001.1